VRIAELGWYVKEKCFLWSVGLEVQIGMFKITGVLVWEFWGRTVERSHAGKNVESSQQPCNSATLGYLVMRETRVSKTA